jgi:transcriptional regulator EpsA
MEGYITLTEREMEYLFRIIDSSTSIFLRHQFFLWAQGELQSLLPHGLLICLFDEGSGQPISIDRFSRTNISEVTLSELCRPDGGVVFRVMSAWNAGKNRPVLLCPYNATTLAYRQFASDLKRDDLERMAAHGMFDANGRTRSLFTFTQIPIALTERHAYFLELLMPHMHMALVRMLFHERHQHGTAAGKTKKLITDRQTEILRHVQMGKSNDEIAHLLNISPLTVKNHIQKILHKLDVSNRAHAVAKAMSLKITL